MEEILHKINTALEFLKDGQSFHVGDLRLGIEGKGNLIVTGWSQYNHFENLTKRQSMQELEEIKVLFKKMLEVSAELKSFVKDKNIVYSLCFDDYGRVSLPICSEKDGVVEWEADIKS